MTQKVVCFSKMYANKVMAYLLSIQAMVEVSCPNIHSFWMAFG